MKIKVAILFFSKFCLLNLWTIPMPVEPILVYYCLPALVPVSHSQLYSAHGLGPLHTGVGLEGSMDDMVYSNRKGTARSNARTIEEVITGRGVTIQ